KLASDLCLTTPLGRYLERVLGTVSGDVLVVLRYAEDAQLAREALGEFLTAPGRFVGVVPELRVTTPLPFYDEITARMPTVLIWAASAIAGAREYIGDAALPTEFRLLVAGQDTVVLRRALEIALGLPEYEGYRNRARSLCERLPRSPREFGGLRAAF